MNKQYLYRIYTESKPNLVQLTQEAFPKGATILDAMGVWNGGHEHSAIIEVLIEHVEDIPRVYAFAEQIRVTNHQEAVLIVMAEVGSVMLKGPSKSFEWEVPTQSQLESGHLGGKVDTESSN